MGLGQSEIIDLYKEEYPEVNHYNDADIWPLVQKYAKENNFAVGGFDETASRDVDIDVSRGNSDYLKSVKQAEVTPDAWNNLLTTHISLALAEDDPYWQNVYNTSQAGTWYQAKYGKPKFDVGDYDPGVMGHITTFFASMLSPLDAATFAGMGKFGAVGKRAGLNVLSKTGLTYGVAKKVGLRKMMDKAAKSKNHFLRGAILKAPELAMGMGYYTGATSALRNAADQKIQTGNINFGKVLLAGAKGTAEGIGLGALTGGVVGGAFKGAYLTAKHLQKNNPKFPGAVSAMESVGLYGQVPAEAAAFTAFGKLIHPDEQPFWKGFVTNLGVIGTMKGMSRFFSGKTLAEVEVAEQVQVHQHAKIVEIKEKLATNQRLVKAAEEKGIKLPKEVFEEIAQLQQKLGQADFDIIKYKQLEKDRIELEKKPMEKWSTDEMAWYAENVLYGPHGYWTLDWMQEYINPDFTINRSRINKYYDTLEQKTGKTISQQDRTSFEQKLRLDYEYFLEQDAKLNRIATGEVEVTELDNGGLQVESPNKPIGVKPASKKSLEKMNNQELIDEGSRVLKRPSDEIKTEFDWSKRQGILSPEEAKRTGLDRDRLIDQINETREPLTEKTSIDTVDEWTQMDIFKEPVHYAGATDKAYKLMDAFMDLIGEWNPNESGIINSSRYYLQAITQNMIMRVPRGGAQTGTGAIVGAKTDIAYLKVYKSYSDFLRRQGKDISEATWKDVEAFINYGSGTGKSTIVNDALSYLYKESTLKNMAKIDPEILQKAGDITRIGHYTENAPQGLRIGEFKSGEGKVVFKQAKSLLEKGIAISKEFKNILSNIVKKIMPDDIAGDNIFRNSKGEAITNTPVANMVKEYFGGHSRQDMRKGLSHFVTARYGENSVEQYVVDALGLGHKQAGAMAKAGGSGVKYIPKPKEYQAIFDKINKDFIDIVTGRRELTTKEKTKLAGMTKTRAKGDGISIYELMEGWQKFAKDINAQKKKNKKNKQPELYRIKNTRMDYDTAEGILRMTIETSARPQDVVPPKAADIKTEAPVTKGEFQKRYQKVSKPTKERAKQIAKEKIELEKEAQLEKEKADSSLDPNKQPVLQKEIQKEDMTFETVAEYDAFLEKQRKKNPGMELKKEYGTDKEYVGKFMDGVIEVVMGHKSMKTFFHEQGHRLKAMIDSTGNKKLKGIWKKGEREFLQDAKDAGYFTKLHPKEVASRLKIDVNKLKEKQYKEYVMEEYISDRIADYAAQRTTAKGFEKVAKFAKAIWSNAKQLFFGRESLSKKDLIRIMGNKAYKGFATSKILTGPARFSMSGTALVGEVQKMWNFVARQTGQSNIKGQNLWGKNLGFGDKWSIENGTVDQLLLFKEAMEGSGPGAKYLQKEQIKKSETIKDIESKRIDPSVNFTDKIQRDFLKDLGVSDGNIYSATKTQLKAYQRIVDDRYIAPDRTIMHHIDDATIKDIFSGTPSGEWLKSFSKNKPEMLYKFVPVSDMFKLLGQKELAYKLATRQAIETDLIGTFRELEVFAMDQVGKKAWEGKVQLKPGKGFLQEKDSIRNMMYLLDAETYIEARNNGWLTPAEKTFMEKTFHKDWLNAEKPLDVRKYEPDVLFNTKNPEGRIAKAYFEFTKDFSNNFKNRLKEIMSEAEYEAFEKSGNIEWIEKNIFVTRQYTKEGLKLLENPDNPFVKKWMKEEAMARAKKTADNLGEKDPTKYYDGALEEVKKDYQTGDWKKWSPTKFSSTFIKRRGPRVKSRIEVKGKEIEIYERNWESTSKRYAVGFAKLLSNIEIFPEFVKIEGLKTGRFSGEGLEGVMKQLEATDMPSKWIDPIKGMLKNELGIAKEVDPSPWGSFMSSAAQILAKTGLSFPTAGAKNFTLGTASTLQAYEMKFVLRGMSEVLSPEFRKQVVAMGATELGMREYQSHIFSKGLDKIFWFGGMRPTENFNRYLAIAVGKLDFKHQVESVRTFKPGEARYEQAKRRLHDFYEMSEGEVSTLKKYGVSEWDAGKNVDAHGATFKMTSIQKAKESRSLNNAYKKANFMAHVNTQGASLSLFMPHWAEGQTAKALTLFKRMAYAASRNTVRNVNLAAKNKQPIRLIMQALLPFAAGQGLMQMNHILFGTPDAGETKEWLPYILHTVHTGEFLGLGSDIFALLDGDDDSRVSIYPSILDAGAHVYHGVANWADGGKHGKQSAKDTVKKVVSLYNGYHKLTDKGLLGSEYRRNKNDIEEIWNEHYEDVYPDKYVTFDEYSNPNAKFVRDFRDAFDSGDMEDAAKQYVKTFHALAADYYREGRDENDFPIRTMEEAFKQASITMHKRVKNLNPNWASSRRATGEIAQRRAAGAIKWYTDLHNKEKADKLIQNMIAQEEIYLNRWSELKEEIGKLRETYNIDYDNWESVTGSW